MNYQKPQLNKLYLVICVDSANYQVSLIVDKVYLAWPENKLLRVIDETGEDYLYEYDNFIDISDTEKLMEYLISKLERRQL